MESCEWKFSAGSPEKTHGILVRSMQGLQRKQRSPWLRPLFVVWSLCRNCFGQCRLYSLIDDSLFLFVVLVMNDSMDCLYVLDLSTRHELWKSKKWSEFRAQSWLTVTRGTTINQGEKSWLSQNSSRCCRSRSTVTPRSSFSVQLLRMKSMILLTRRFSQTKINECFRTWFFDTKKTNHHSRNTIAFGGIRRY